MKRNTVIALLLTFALLVSAVPNTAAYGLAAPVTGDMDVDRQAEPDVTDPTADPDSADPADDSNAEAPAEDDSDAEAPVDEEPDAADPSYDDWEEEDFSYDGSQITEIPDIPYDVPQEDVAEVAVYNEPEAIEVFAASGSWQPKPNRTVSSANVFPLKLSNGDVLQINGPLTYSAKTGESAIQLKSGAKASIIINGSVTLHGANASGTIGATAAINVPEGAQLTIYSAHDEELSTSKAAPKDTLTVTGGAAAQGADGTIGEKKEIKKEEIQQVTTAWMAGNGGNGGGGAAAAIGGNGGNGGVGGAGGIDYQHDQYIVEGTWSGRSYYNVDDHRGTSGNDGKPGGVGGGAGTIYISGRLTLNASGGSAAAGGSGAGGDGGYARTKDKDHMIGGCGGGGGGGGGCAAPAIGAGGAGGSGGGSGGHPGSDVKGNVQGPGGGGGGGGWPNGGGGGGGGAECSDAENGRDNSSKGGNGGNGGSAGSSGISGSSGTTTGTAGHGYDTKKKRYDAEPGSGGAGGSGLQGNGGAGGSGGREKDDKNYNGGKGGDGGKAADLKAWHNAGSLILSTAANLRTYSWGDGGGKGTTTALTPYVIYDLMDCQITLDSDPVIYNGKQQKPAVTSITYSVSTDRDNRNITGSSSATLNNKNYTISGYGENIHCPSGTVTVRGNQSSSRTTTQTNGAVIGSVEKTFTIKKATLTAPLSLSTTTPYVNQSVTATLNTYTSPTAGDGKLSQLWRETTKKAEGPEVTWSLQNSSVGKFTETNGLQAKFTLTDSTATSVTVVAVLRNMNDFEDCTVRVTIAPKVPQKWTTTLSKDPPHSRVPISVNLPAAITSATYQWFADGTKITGATAQSYTPTAADIGKKLSVLVTPDAATGYGTLTVTAKNAVEEHKYNTNGFCTVCGEYQPATLSGSVYQISNGGQMFWFAALVNGDGTHAVFAKKDPAASAVLTKDVALESREWTPIGSLSNIYTGTFDGQGKTVSGMFITKTNSYAGLFGRTSGTICNFTVVGSITTFTAGGSRIGGAVGSAYGGKVSGICSKVSISDGGCLGHHFGGVVGGLDNPETAIERCVFEGSLYAAVSTDCIGGIVGYTNGGARIRYCANRGTVTTQKEDAYTGGILGYVNNAYPSIQNCYNYGKVQNGGGSHCGAIVGWMRTHNAARYTDNYYLDGSAPAGFGAGSSTTAKAYAKDQEAFASGEVCYLVNGGSSEENVIWRQNVDNDVTPYDKYPVFDAAIVVRNGSHHDCTLNETRYTYSNTVITEVLHDKHDYVNGFCACCDALQSAGQENGVYQITNGGQFFWFAQQVNAKAVAQNSDAALSADIDLEGGKDGQAAGYEGITKNRNFPGVGTSACPYQGTFTGNGHTVSDLYISRTNTTTAKLSGVGLFGCTSGATISGLTVRGSIQVRTETQEIERIGGVVGSADSGTSLSRLFSYVNITGGGTEELHHVGGVAGDVLGVDNGKTGMLSKIFQCMYFGAMDLENAQDCVGGVVGYINNVLVQHCANFGTVKTDGSDDYTGGVVGYLNNSDGNIRNCYNYGTVQNGGGKHCGGVIGWLRGHEAARITDNYYLDTSASAGIGSGSDVTGVEVPPRAKAAFVSGEVCYLVNGKTSVDSSVWRQDIDNGNTPYDVYPVFDAALVYRHSDGVYSNDEERISVTIAWGDMTFDYREGRWDPDKHEYSGGWSPLTAESNDLSVKNESNVALTADITFAAQQAFVQYDLTGTFSGIAAGANRIERGATLATELSLRSLTPASLKNQGRTKIGAITVKLTTVEGGT